jgi:hypothetical protein
MDLITERAGALLMFNKASDNLSDAYNVLVEHGYTGSKFALATYDI